MRAGMATYVGTVLVGLLSLLTAGWSIAWQIDDASLFAARAASQVAPLPDGVLPAGAAAPQVQPPLTVAERRRVYRALWRGPLDPRAVNLLYADAVRTDRPLAPLRDVLARLGWRFTPAQLNLMMRAVLDSRFGDVLDRVDALLRRQKQPALAYSVLATMEALPQVQRDVLRKLIVQPRWRQDYLSVIGPQSGGALLDARVRTMAALLRLPGGTSRSEMAPSLSALAASGRARAAYGLWMRQSPREEAAENGGNLVYDPGFQRAAAVAGTPDLNIPFEWRLAQNMGYAAQISDSGVAITWDRRGVPVFLSQLVPVRPGYRYLLVLRGSADRGDMQTLLAPTLTCGAASIPFEPANDSRRGEARYRSDQLPKTCDMGMLAIGGAVDSGSGNVDIMLTQVRLNVAGDSPGSSRTAP